MTVLVDGVFFQLARSGISRVWREIIPRLAARSDRALIVLDRGGIGSDFPGVTMVPFPAYRDTFAADDSILLERVCRHFRAEVFASTYYTTPIETPSVLLVYDMIPERLGFDLAQRPWREKEVAIAHARRHVCISPSTRRDLLEAYPELDPATTTAAYPGVDADVFSPRAGTGVAELRARLGLDREFLLLVGRLDGYKNGRLLFDALEKMTASGDDVDFDVLCVGNVGGVGDLDHPGWAARSRPGVSPPRIITVHLDDDELAAAYCAASALVYPSLYEGFGLPVVEAMSCGCPVITTAYGSLADVGGDAVIRIGGHSTEELIDALHRVRADGVRRPLIERGFAKAAPFRWDSLATAVSEALDAVRADGDRGTFAEFSARWRRLRELHAAVDAY